MDARKKRQLAESPRSFADKLQARPGVYWKFLTCSLHLGSPQVRPEKIPEFYPILFTTYGCVVNNLRPRRAYRHFVDSPLTGWYPRLFAVSGEQISVRGVVNSSGTEARSGPAPDSPDYHDGRDGLHCARCHSLPLRFRLLGKPQDP